MLNREQKLILASLVRENKNILMAPGGTAVKARLKKAAWEDVLKKLVSTGAVLSLKELKDTTWNNLRRQAIKHFQDFQKTGSAGGKILELDNIVLDVIGRDSSTLNAIDVEETVIMNVSELDYSFAEDSTQASYSIQNTARELFQITPGFQTPTHPKHSSLHEDSEEEKANPVDKLWLIMRHMGKD